MSTENIAAELVWDQPKWSRRYYELRAGEERIAIMQYPSMWRSEAHVAFGEDKFVIAPAGFWETRLVVRTVDTNTGIAATRSSWRGMREIVFTNGRSFKFQPRGILQTSWVFIPTGNDEILTIRKHPRSFHAGARITLSTAAAQYPEIRVLLALGFHLMLMAQSAG